MSMNGFNENTTLTMEIDGNPMAFSWPQFAVALTTRQCNETGCFQPNIASTSSLDVFWLLFCALLVLFM